MPMVSQEPLASEMVVLLRKELTMARNRIDELENRTNNTQNQLSDLEKSHKDEILRAESAETMLKALSSNVALKPEDDLDESKEKFSPERLRNKMILAPEEKVKDKDELSSLRKSLMDMTADKEELLRATESHAQNMDTLKAQLAELNEKRDKQRSLKRKHRQKCQEQCEINRTLESRLKTLAEKNKGLANDKQRVNDLQARQTAHRFYASSEFGTFLKTLAVPEVRPETRLLMSIGEWNIDLISTLSSDPFLEKHHTFCFRFSAVNWYNGCHAIAFAPSHVHELREGTDWHPSNELSPFKAGDNVELFYEDNTSTFYSGTYKCHSTTRWSKDGVVCPWDEKVNLRFK
ncbi:hypothetical protein H0H92_004562 [Tricholoma furcatifolium]|nr:hypothetical protein H0H92_004562 [Tricholoma furcatifolium]